MTIPVIKGSSYALVHTPNLMMQHGSTQVMERLINPQSEYLNKIPNYLRSFQQVVNYAPNQVYIGNLQPDQLRDIGQPWYVNSPPASARGKFGEIIPEELFLALLQLVDTFELVLLSNQFISEATEKLHTHPLFSPGRHIFQGALSDEIEECIAQAEATGLYWQDKLVGCVRRAHVFDPNLSAHIMLENLAAKASGVLALKLLLANTGFNPGHVDFIIEASEEACGDMNQRGGGNFAKAIGEAAGCYNASGCDVRSFCAGPVHALVMAAGLVKAGVHKNVVIVAGGSTSKLGMNGKAHVAKGIPILEDVLGAFAVLVGTDDGSNPAIRTDIIGRHKVGSGSSPQAVIEALISSPLAKVNLGIINIDKYSVEMQNPEITLPAGAGDIPGANYKMIGALAIKQGEIKKDDLGQFIQRHGMPGFAPTQGHIPSGIPFLGHAREQILAGKITRTMIIGKGSLFLARMTSQYDGVSVVLETNTGEVLKRQSSRGRKSVRLVLTTGGSELGPDELVQGVELAVAQQSDLEVLLVGPKMKTRFKHLEASSEVEAHGIMESLLASGEAQGAVTMHYNFPGGVASVGRLLTPAIGAPILLASTTGSSAPDRVKAMTLNTLGGIAVAKTLGIACPRVGILNIDGARKVKRVLEDLKQQGYQMEFADSVRQDGGCLLRGNDLLRASADIVVCDSLTGNMLVKVLSAFTSGGIRETQGWGYGPGIGRDFNKIINIISRSSGAPVVAGALIYAWHCVNGNLLGHVAEEYQAAQEAGLSNLWAEETLTIPQGSTAPPPSKPVTAEITGLEILQLEEAMELLWRKGIYAETGMGCTGPVILVSDQEEILARAILSKHRYLAG